MLIRSELVTAPTDEQLTLSEVKAHLRVDSNDEDAYIYSLISVARDEAEAVCGRRFGAQSWKLYFDRFERIKLHGCGQVSSATLYWRDQNGTWQALDASQYEIVKAVPAYAFYKDDFNVPTTGDYAEVVRIDVSCGESAPRGVKQWMLLRIGTLYEHREDAIVGAGVLAYPMVGVPQLLAAHRVIDFS
jgi:uncharacterized phiE125 gp8 family phage protein